MAGKTRMQSEHDEGSEAMQGATGGSPPPQYTQVYQQGHHQGVPVYVPMAGHSPPMYTPTPPKRAILGRPMVEPPPEQSHWVTNLRPVMGHVNLTLGIPVNKGPAHHAIGIFAKCLVDTGCSKTTISQGAYELLMEQFNNNCHLLTRCATDLLSCTGQATNVLGMMSLRIYIAENVYRDTTAMVVNGLIEDFILGYDFLTAAWTKSMDKDHIVMKNNNDGEDILLKINKTYCKMLPCHNAQLQCGYLKVVEKDNGLKAEGVSDLKNGVILIKPPKEKKTTKVKMKKGKKKVKKDRSNDAAIRSKKATSRTNQDLDINPSNREKPLDIDKSLGKLDNLKKDPRRKPTLSMARKEDGKPKKMNKGEMKKDNLKKDPHIAQLTDGKTMETTLELDDETSLTTSQLMALFDTSHLSIRDKRLARAMFHRQRRIFDVAGNMYDGSEEDEGMCLFSEEKTPKNEKMKYPKMRTSKDRIQMHIKDRTYISSFGLKDACFHEAHPLTAYWSHTQMCSTKSPQGLSKTSNHLQMLMRKTFEDMKDIVLCDASALLVATRSTVKHHFRVVEKVLRRLAEAKLQIRPASVMIARKSIELRETVSRQSARQTPKAMTEYRCQPLATTTTVHEQNVQKKFVKRQKRTEGRNIKTERTQRPGRGIPSRVDPRQMSKDRRTSSPNMQTLPIGKKALSKVHVSTLKLRPGATPTIGNQPGSQGSRHVKGKSKRAVRHVANISEKELEGKDIHNSKDIAKIMDMTTKIHAITDGKFTVDEVKRAQSVDEACSTIINNINKAEVKRMHYLEEGLLFRIGNIKDRLVLPMTLFDSLVYGRHIAVNQAHPNADEILNEMKSKFYLPNDEFSKRVVTVENRCFPCKWRNAKKGQLHGVDKTSSLTNRYHDRSRSEGDDLEWEIPVETRFNRNGKRRITNVKLLPVSKNMGTIGKFFKVEKPNLNKDGSPEKRMQVTCTAEVHHV